MATDTPDEELAHLRAQVEELRRTVSELLESQRRTRFGAIDVERINVVEPDGTLRLTISNKMRAPDPVVGGKPFKRSGGNQAGLIFFNEAGDECGGLIFGGTQEEGRPAASALLAFDQFQQDQIVGILYSDEHGQRMAGLKVWERPDLPRAGVGGDCGKRAQYLAAAGAP